MEHPGFFAHITLGEDVLTDPGDNTDLTGLGLALVMSEDATEVKNRFTTWGLTAESATVYQRLTQKNTIILGRNGLVFKMEEDIKADEGGVIAQKIVTEDLPIQQADFDMASDKRLYSITWQTKTNPPSAGHDLFVIVTDSDNPLNTQSSQVVQFDRKVRLDIGLRARRWTITWQFNSSTDFDLLGYGYTFQVLNQPYKGDDQ